MYLNLCTAYTYLINKNQLSLLQSFLYHKYSRGTGSKQYVLHFSVGLNRHGKCKTEKSVPYHRERATRLKF
jgi:hypothetical protein